MNHLVFFSSFQCWALANDIELHCLVFNTLYTFNLYSIVFFRKPYPNDVNSRHLRWLFRNYSSAPLCICDSKWQFWFLWTTNIALTIVHFSNDIDDPQSYLFSCVLFFFSSFIYCHYIVITIFFFCRQIFTNSIIYLSIF